MSIGRLRRGKRVNAATAPSSIAITANDNSVSVTQSSTVTITYTLTRVNFGGTVTPTVSGLPAGVTGSWSVSPLTADDPSTILTLSASTGASPVVADAFLATFSGSGVSDVVDAGTVTVIESSEVTPFFAEDFTGLQVNPYGGFVYANTLGTVDATIVNFDGYNCARFRYGPNAPGADDSKQLNYDIGKYVRELWIEFDLHVPSNFQMREPVSNNKLMQLWRDTYSDFVGGTQQFGYEYWILSGLPRAEATARAMVRNVVHGYITDIDNDASNQDLLISAAGPIVVGDWTRVRMRGKGSSAFGVSDGLYKVWFGDTLFTNIVDYPIHNMFSSPADVRYRCGYLMGYINSGFTSQTDFHIKRLRFYDTDPGWG